MRDVEEHELRVAGLRDVGGDVGGGECVLEPVDGDEDALDARHDGGIVHGEQDVAGGITDQGVVHGAEAEGRRALRQLRGAGEDDLLGGGGLEHGLKRVFWMSMVSRPT